jgi:hypothetical protein
VPDEARVIPGGQGAVHRLLEQDRPDQVRRDADGHEEEGEQDQAQVGQDVAEEPPHQPAVEVPAQDVLLVQVHQECDSSSLSFWLSHSAA